MLASSHQVPTMAPEESDRVVLRNQQGAGAGKDPQGACALAPEIKTEYDRLTDVMHVDLCFPPTDAERVDVIDVGEQLGFPGQIVARVDMERRIIYGLTIQNFSGFKWRFFWRYRMASIQRALQFMLKVLRAGLWIDRNNRPAALHA
jgi:hypothetical protein